MQSPKPRPRRCRDADLVVLAVPVGAMGAIAAEIAPHLAPGAIVTDVGSGQGRGGRGRRPHLPAGVHFIPGHPMAGTEYSGPRSGFADAVSEPLVAADAARVTDPQALARLRGCRRRWAPTSTRWTRRTTIWWWPWSAMCRMLIAYTMVGVADHMRRVSNSEVIKYSASGFRDFTRIAASDPTMWRDVFLTNKDATLDILGRFTEELFVLQRAIRMGDGDHLHAYFTRTRAIRRGIIEAGQDTAAPDFGRVANPSA
jgi:cyclohexadieny/prephenate dehydrogenase